jgi:hypothetical protein
LAFPITDRFSLASGLNLNKFRDIDYGEGVGYYGTLKALYKTSEAFQMDLKYEVIKSKQALSDWRSDAVFLELQWGM